MTRVRVAALMAATLPLLTPALAHADLRDECWKTVPSFRLSALVCPKVPDGIG